MLKSCAVGGVLQHFSVSPRPQSHFVLDLFGPWLGLGLGVFGSKGLGTGLDNYFYHLSILNYYTTLVPEDFLSTSQLIHPNLSNVLPSFLYFVLLNFISILWKGIAGIVIENEFIYFSDYIFQSPRPLCPGTGVDRHTPGLGGCRCWTWSS